MSRMTAIAASVASRLGFTSPTRNSRTDSIDGFRVLSHCGFGYWKLAAASRRAPAVDRPCARSTGRPRRGRRACSGRSGSPGSSAPRSRSASWGSETRSPAASRRRPCAPAAEAQRLADDGRVGAEVLPERMTQNRDRFRSRHVFACAERAAEGAGVPSTSKNSADTAMPGTSRIGLPGTSRVRSSGR